MGSKVCVWRRAPPPLHSLSMVLGSLECGAQHRFGEGFSEASADHFPESCALAQHSKNGRFQLHGYG
jgi:hypothetical protein